MSEINTQNLSLDNQLFNAAADANLNLAKDLYSKGANINMAIMGATWNETLTGDHGKIARWTLDNGAEILLGLSNKDIIKFYSGEYLKKLFKRNAGEMITW